MNTGPPIKDVRTATGKTCGLSMIRAAISDIRSKAAPQRHDAGMTKR